MDWHPGSVGRVTSLILDFQALDECSADRKEMNLTCADARVVQWIVCPSRDPEEDRVREVRQVVALLVAQTTLTAW